MQIKTYIQAPRTPEHEKLFTDGYRVKRDENRKFFAQVPDGNQIYSGDHLDDAWGACKQHAHQEEEEL